MIYSKVQVKKWVDYSTKYGLGYLLSDGSTGVCFLDKTTILDKNGDKFDFIEKKEGDDNDTVAHYNKSELPAHKELQKKISILQHFKKHL